MGRGKGGGEARRNTEWQASSGRVQYLTRRSHPKGSADFWIHFGSILEAVHGQCGGEVLASWLPQLMKGQNAGAEQGQCVRA